MIAVFTQADPDDVRRRTLFAADLSFENTYKESGFSRAFTNEIAASTSGTGITGKIGPKISSCMTLALGSTPRRIVGGM